MIRNHVHGFAFFPWKLALIWPKIRTVFWWCTQFEHVFSMWLVVFSLTQQFMLGDFSLLFSSFFLLKTPHRQYFHCFFLTCTTHLVWLSFALSFVEKMQWHVLIKIQSITPQMQLKVSKFSCRLLWSHKT